MSAGTPKRPIRIPNELWEAALTKAREEGTNASEVIRRLLTEWLGDGSDKAAP